MTDVIDLQAYRIHKQGSVLKTKENEVKPEPIKDFVDLNVRIEKIKASLDRINKLMKDLRHAE